MADTCHVKAPAKLNLGLRIGEKGPDGFHRLRTIFQTIRLFDDLEFSFSSDHDRDRLEVAGPVDVTGGYNNLIIGALRELRVAYKELPHAHVQLHKRIPTGAGLGGGSSDAAAVIHAVRYLFDPDYGSDTERRVAMELGADVPFFLRGGTMFGEGRGEQLTDLRDLEAHVVVVVPPFQIDTEWAYDNYKKYLPDSENDNNINFSISDRQKHLEIADLDPSNDFEPLVRSAHDLSEELRGELSRFSDITGLSGSGSAFYALFEHEDEAEECEEHINRQFSVVRCYRRQLLPADSYPLIDEKEASSWT